MKVCHGTIHSAPQQFVESWTTCPKLEVYETCWRRLQHYYFSTLRPVKRLSVKSNHPNPKMALFVSRMHLDKVFICDVIASRAQFSKWIFYHHDRVVIRKSVRSLFRDEFHEKMIRFAFCVKQKKSCRRPYGKSTLDSNGEEERTIR